LKTRSWHSPPSVCSNHFLSRCSMTVATATAPSVAPTSVLTHLGRTLQHKRVNILVEADIRGCFDAVHPEWLLKLLRQRIGDERVLRLISRM
jgi:hypothetical protein